MCLPPLARGAEPFTVNPEPRTFREAQNKLKEIPPYLENDLFCGGWNRSIEVGEELGTGRVAKVTGLPGREGKPLGAVESGMGLKSEEPMLFPDSADGFATACEPGQPGLVKKTVWDQAQNKKVEKSFHNPAFDDPPCLDRSRANPSNVPSTTPPDFYKLDPPYTEKKCEEFRDWLNKFRYQDCRVLQVQLDAQCNPRKDANGNIIKNCLEWADRYTCTDAWVNGAPAAEEVTPACGNNAGTPPPSSAPSTETSPNATPKCTGEECRCPKPDGTACDVIADKGNGNNRDYKSYFRKYMNATYARATVPDVPADKGNNAANVACYGFYDEFDPKKKQTQPRDRRCMIDINVLDYPETQKGRGTIQVSGVVDPDPLQNAEQRNDGIYDQESDLWYQKLGRSFSFINEKVFKDRYAGDLTNVYLDIDALDQGELKATPQFSDQKPLAESNQMRAFDDTGENRTVVRWWQKQQTEAASLFHRPVIRMLLPSSWAYGIDMNDPLFRGNSDLPELDPHTARGQSIEIQIHADEDLLGAVLGYLQRSLLLPVEEAPIPLVVPLGSPTEFRAIAQDWCQWHITKSGKSDCEDAPEQVKKLIARLEEYADRTEETRKLRTALASYAGSILQLQYDITRPLSEWISGNVVALRNIVDEQKLIAEELVPQWESVQRAYARFERETNMPWCMNQRYTPPIYSLLDPWLPARENSGSLYADGGNGKSLPDLAGLEMRPQDAVLDLTSLAYLTGSIKLPVLKPTQVRITVPRPPNAENDHGLTGNELPAFPDMAPILDAVRQSIGRLPTVETETYFQPPTPSPLGEQKLQEIRNRIAGMSTVISEMDATYDTFWKSLTMFGQDETPPSCQKEGDLKPLECCGWDEDACVHVEMDLLERLTRIASRPLVQLKDDYLSVGLPRTESSVCLPEDHACDLLNAQRKEGGIQWEVSGNVSNEKNIEQLREDLRRLTLPQDVGNVSSADAMPYDVEWEDLLPSFDVPSAIDLFGPERRTTP